MVLSVVKLSEKVKKNLWNRGFAVKDRTADGLEYELIVEGYRVKVSGVFMKDVDWGKYDVIALVQVGKGAFAGKLAVRYLKADIWYNNPVEVFINNKSK
jgi:hypothetical protein